MKTVSELSLFRVVRDNITLGEVVEAFGVLTAQAEGDVLALISSERSVEVVALAALSSQQVLDAFEVECWSSTLSCRWIAIGDRRPFVGTAAVLGEAPVSIDGWTNEEIECSSRSTQYACWGDVAEVSAAFLEVGDDARRFRVSGSTLGPRAGDRLSLRAVEYMRSDNWGNQAIFDERIVALEIDGGRS